MTLTLTSDPNSNIKLISILHLYILHSTFYQSLTFHSVSLKVPTTHRLCHRPTGSVKRSVKVTAGESIESKCELQGQLAVGGT